jgi:hypothetical protein
MGGTRGGLEVSLEGGEVAVEMGVFGVHGWLFEVAR